MKNTKSAKRLPKRNSRNTAVVRNQTAELLLESTTLTPLKKDRAFKKLVDSYAGLLKEMHYSSTDFVRDKAQEIALEQR